MTRATRTFSIAFTVPPSHKALGPGGRGNSMVSSVDFHSLLKVTHSNLMNFRSPWNPTPLHNSSALAARTTVRVKSTLAFQGFIPYSRRSSRFVVRADTDSRRRSERSPSSEEVIAQLERSFKEPAEVLDSMGERLSAEDLEQVLCHFAGTCKDPWFALDVFEWMQKTNRVADNTHELVLDVMEVWARRLVQMGQSVKELKAVLDEIKYTGLKPVSRVMHTIACSYWEERKKSEVLTFVKEVMCSKLYEEEGETPLADFMQVLCKADQAHQALKLVIELRCSGLQLDQSAYRTALLAAVREQRQLNAILRRLKEYKKTGLISTDENENSISTYVNLLHEQVEQVARWAAEGVTSREHIRAIYDRLLAMYCLAGKPLDAERYLWQMSLLGAPPLPAMFNAVLGMSALQNQAGDAYRLLDKMESVGGGVTESTYSVLIGGFIKGGNPKEAASSMVRMLERGFRPESHVIFATLMSLESAGLESDFVRLLKKLAEEEVMEPHVLYYHFKNRKLSIVRLL